MCNSILGKYCVHDVEFVHFGEFRCLGLEKHPFTSQFNSKMKNENNKHLTWLFCSSLLLVIVTQSCVVWSRFGCWREMSPFRGVVIYGCTLHGETDKLFYCLILFCQVHMLLCLVGAIGIPDSVIVVLSCVCLLKYACISSGHLAVVP